jgi:hypothetical protein
MAEDYNILQENEKRYPRFNGFGEMQLTFNFMYIPLNYPQPEYYM